MNVQDLRLVRRMAELMPIKDPLKKERTQIEKIEFSKVITFISKRPVLHEIAFYYLYHNKIIDFVKVLSAEEIKDIYFKNHTEYSSIYDIQYPIVVVELGNELYNKQMVTILNVFEDTFLKNPLSKALIFLFNGIRKEFDCRYESTQEISMLNAGKIISMIPSTSTKASTTDTYGVKDF